MKKSISIRSKFVHLKEVELFIESLLQPLDCNSRQVAYITLGVCESVNNAIYHGNKCDENKFVTLFADVNNSSLLVQVKDEGPGFDFNNIPDPTTPENIKNEGGRGLYIIRNVTDELSFKNNGSIIELKFKIKSAHSISS